MELLEGYIMTPVYSVINWLHWGRVAAISFSVTLYISNKDRLFSSHNTKFPGI